MYPDNAYCESYPAKIVNKILREHPDATVERLHRLMQEEWDARKPPLHQPSMAELADDLGL